jgi:formylglycine-generating enzyme required for sulfatase activity
MSLVKIEIELKDGLSADDIYELKEMLSTGEHEATIKLAAPVEGEMGALVHLLEISMHAGATLMLEGIYHQYIHPAVKKLLAKKSLEQGMGEMEVSTTVKKGDERLYVSESTTGGISIHKQNFKLDTNRTKVLLIGNSEFLPGFTAIQPVKKNLKGLEELLTNKKNIGIPPGNIQVLFNKNTQDIKRALLQLNKEEDIETLIIYYAGHGYRTGIDELTLITADSEKIGNEIIGGLEFKFISEKILKQSVAKQKIVIIDACHSGIAAQSHESDEVKIDVKGSYTLTSTSAKHSSYFNEDADYTYFTGSLIEVLSKGSSAAGEMLSLDDLYNYIYEVCEDRKDFPLPTQKNGLNIPAAKFYIASNPSFSYELAMSAAEKAFKNKRYEFALGLYQKLQAHKTDAYVAERILACDHALRSGNKNQLQKKISIPWSKFIIVTVSVAVVSSVFYLLNGGGKNARGGTVDETVQNIMANMVMIDDTIVKVPGGTWRSFTFNPYYEIVDSFRMNKYEITVAEWRSIMDESAPKLSRASCDSCPVEVEFNDVTRFIKKLNERTGRDFRIPTEAEWLLAARGGNKSKGFEFSGSNEPADVAWYNYGEKEYEVYGTSIKSKSQPVGKKHPNELGLYDMSGNGAELTRYKTEDRSSDYFALKGGNWNEWVSQAKITAPAEYDLSSFYVNGRNSRMAIRLCLSFSRSSNPDTTELVKNVYVQRKFADYGILFYRVHEYKKAFYFLDKVKKMNDPYVWYYYAQLNRDNGNNNPEIAFQFMRKAAYANLPSAQMSLSAMFKFGEGTVANQDSAAYWSNKYQTMPDGSKRPPPPDPGI